MTPLVDRPTLLQLVEPFLKPLLPYLADPDVTEIMVNAGGARVYIEVHGRVRFMSGISIPTSHLIAAIETIAEECQRTLTPDVSWEMNAKLPDGSRVAAMLAPVATAGPVLTIRRHPATPFTVTDLVAAGTMTDGQSAWIADQVRARRTILFAGAVASGKTTMVNAFAALIPSDDRLAILEDTQEIQVPHANVIPCEARPDPVVWLADLLQAVLRHRPDRILLGEVRYPTDARALLLALTTGHAGSFTTLHANDAHGALDRLARLALTGGDDSERGVREAIASAIHVVVHLARVDGRRTVTEILDVHGYDPVTQRWVATSVYPRQDDARV